MSKKKKKDNDELIFVSVEALPKLQELFESKEWEPEEFNEAALALLNTFPNFVKE